MNVDNPATSKSTVSTARTVRSMLISGSAHVMPVSWLA
jgi:hypothetical protein